MADYTFTQGDTKPYFAITVKNDLTNGAVDLTGATVTFNFKHQRGVTAKVAAGACTITDAVNGKVEYRWASTDLDDPGMYEAAFKITDSGAKVQTVRIDDVEVKAKLA